MIIRVQVINSAGQVLLEHHCPANGSERWTAAPGKHLADGPETLHSLYIQGTPLPWFDNAVRHAVLNAPLTAGSLRPVPDDEVDDVDMPLGLVAPAAPDSSRQPPF